MGTSASLTPTCHIDTFTRSRIFALDPWPELVHTLPELRYPSRLNAATTLLDHTGAQRGYRRTAVVTRSSEWTYADLLARANQTAHLLSRDLGVVPGNRVLLMGRNSPWFVASLLGILKAGAVAVPLPPKASPYELARMTDAVRPLAALGDADDLDGLTTTGVPTVSYGTGGVEDLRRRSARYPDTYHQIDLAADDVALILFSSGTTGIPKATLHFHRDLLAVGDTVGRHLLRLHPNDLVTCNRSMAGTYGLGGLVLSPLRAGSAVLLPEGSGPDSLYEALTRHPVDVLLASPSAYRVGIAHSMTDNLGNLSRCVSGGERLDGRLWQHWRDATGLRIMDVLGATELTNGVLGTAVDRARPGFIGPPVPGYQALVLDANGRPCPDGTPGRLAVRGPTGCRYLGHSKQADAVRNGWTLTGDLCLRAEDGYFSMRGRTDDAVIVDGWNVLPATVESALLSHPTVTEATVVGFTTPTGDTSLAAYVVLAAGVGPRATEDIERSLSARLSAYERPRTLIVVSMIPRTANGKIDRTVLRRRAEMTASTAS